MTEHHEDFPHTPTPELAALADLCGVATSYTGQDGSRQEVSAATIATILTQLGLPISPTTPPEEVLQHTEQLRTARYERMIPPTVCCCAGQTRDFQVHCRDGEQVQVKVLLEDGNTLACPQLNVWVDPVHTNAEHPQTWGIATFQIPALPMGWHRIEATAETTAATATLICSPARLSSAQAFVSRPATGVMAQLYSVRDATAWSVGDYRTLRTVGGVLKNMDFLLVNPMHAAEPCPPVEDSPYLPTTRRFTNPLYIHVEDTPEYAAHPELHARIAELSDPLRAKNTTADFLDRNAAFGAKLQALRWLWEAGLGDKRRAELEAYRAVEGEGLEDFARWCAQYAKQREPEQDHSPDFYAWLQMLCQEQETAAQAELTEHMRIGLMADLAVGVHPGGADATTLADVLVGGVSVGAPPDGYNQQGQDWSQPPWHPWELAEQGYAPWRNMLRTILRSAGGIRVDHVLGLFRLWWIPRMQAPTTGTYVRYDHEALVGALVLEAERAGAVVIGEDLGTFEPWVQDYLAGRGVMGTSILWFEGDENGAKPPQAYRKLCLTSVTTHDLPPTAAYLRGEHIALRDRLGVLTRDVEAEYADDAQWQAEVLSTVAEHGGFVGQPCEGYFASGRAREEIADARHGREQRPGGADGLADLEHEPAGSGIIQGLHRYAALTPSALKCICLVDLVGDVRAQNQPGTSGDTYENWRVPLCDSSGRPILAEDATSGALAQAILQAARGQ
ncbi:4-alpha-glucanotransferase [Corynebacterium heidelbergense]|uniref:4-alpha-glucanotransferase n=1 Tax=Corynebacterium heidelbergense TaxID=2055947 RepID=UPI003F6CF01C